jgi:hypothetical protein
VLTAASTGPGAGTSGSGAAAGGPGLGSQIGTDDSTANATGGRPGDHARPPATSLPLTGMPVTGVAVAGLGLLGGGLLLLLLSLRPSRANDMLLRLLSVRPVGGRHAR